MSPKHVKICTVGSVKPRDLDVFMYPIVRAVAMETRSQSSSSFIKSDIFGQSIEMPNNALADADTKKHHLLLAVRKLIYRLDLLKVTINSLDTSCFSKPSNSNLAQIQHNEHIYKICRKKIHLVINLMETWCEMLEKKCSVDSSKAIDSVYWALKSVKENLLKLADPRLTDVVEEVACIIDYANGDIRSIGLELIKPSVEQTLISIFREIKIERDAGVINIASDSDDGEINGKSTKKAVKKKGSCKVNNGRNKKGVNKKSASTSRKRKSARDKRKAESANNNKKLRKDDNPAQLTENSVRCVTRRSISRK